MKIRTLEDGTLRRYLYLSKSTIIDTWVSKKKPSEIKNQTE